MKSMPEEKRFVRLEPVDPETRVEPDGGIVTFSYSLTTEELQLEMAKKYGLPVNRISVGTEWVYRKDNV